MTSSDTPQSSLWQGFKAYFQKDLLPLLADLRLAIVLLLAIAAFSITGTVIEQGETLAFYQVNYPEDPALFGFLSWKVILIAGLDHVYRTWWFLALLILFGASLTACTFTRQFPALGQPGSGSSTLSRASFKSWPSVLICRILLQTR